MPKLVIGEKHVSYFSDVMPTNICNAFSYVRKCFFEQVTSSEALPGVLGNRGIMSFISGEQENTNLKMKGTGEQR